MASTWAQFGIRGSNKDYLREVAARCAGHRSSIPPVLEATAGLAVVPFHGHSTKWTSKDIHEKFGYEYSAAELREWAPRLTSLADKTDKTHVLMNNCYTDYAQKNAAQLIELLEGVEGD